MKCEEIKILLVDYLEGNLCSEMQKKIKEHIEKCEECKAEYINLKDIDLKLRLDKDAINMPTDFMNNVRTKVKNSKGKKVNSRRSFKVMLVASLIVVLTMITVIASEDGLLNFINNVIKKESLHKAVEHGYGTKLNISKVDRDIKVTITYVVADDTTTAIFYEIEDLREHKRYHPSYIKNGFSIENFWGKSKYGNCHEQSSWVRLDNGDSNKASGRLNVLAIDSEEKNIHFTINKLESADGKKEIVEGKWDFKFDVKKYKSKIYDMNKEININGYPIKFTKIELAPTKTILTYEYENHIRSKEEFMGLGDMYLSSGNKTYEIAFWGGGQSGSDSNGVCSSSISFDSMYFDNPEDVTINLRSYSIDISDRKECGIVDPKAPFPQEVQCLGSKIIVDDMTFDKEIKFILKYDFNNRKFENCRFQFEPLDKTMYMNYGYDGHKWNGVFVDKNGEKYDYYDVLGKWSEIRDKKPVLYNTQEKIEMVLFSSNPEINVKKFSEEQLKIPFKVMLDSYTKTKFINKKININLQSK